MRVLLPLLVASLLVAPAASAQKARPMAAPRRVYMQSLRLEMPRGMRRAGREILERAARKHGVSLVVVPLRSGLLGTTYGIQYASASKTKLRAFERAARLATEAEAPPRPTMSGLRLGVHSETNRREENQDTFEQAENAQGDLLLLVFDGAGGHAGGRAAARKGARDVRRFFNASTGDALEAVAQSFDFANRENLQAKRGGDAIGMSTATGVVITKKGELISANLGDSRAYRLSARSGALRRLTRDQNGEAENIITEYLGKQGGIQPEVRSHGRIRSGDRILISSDGLHKFVSDAVIRQHLGRQGVSLDQIAADLAKIAKQNGSDDNITLHLYQHP